MAFICFGCFTILQPSFPKNYYHIYFDKTIKIKKIDTFFSFVEENIKNSLLWCPIQSDNKILFVPFCTIHCINLCYQRKCENPKLIVYSKELIR